MSVLEANPGPISKYLGKYPSDHTLQTATFISSTPSGETLIVSVLTWNLLNKCHSAVGHAHSNNPFNVDESDKDYLARKATELKILLKHIKDGTIDCILLQEVDMFTRDPLFPEVKKFLQQARELGWHFVHTEKSDQARMPLLILYNSNKLNFVSKQPLFPTAAGDKNTSLEALFRYVGNDAEVCIVNMHLDHEKDHRKEILDYLQAQVVAVKFTIIGGDTNHPTDREHISLVGDMNKPTNISRPTDEQKATDDGGMVLLRLDGFMACPAHTGARVEIKEGPGAYFVWVPANALIKSLKRSPEDPENPLGKYIARLFDPRQEKSHTQHMSLPGLPWVAENHKAVLYVGISSKQQSPSTG